MKDKVLTVDDLTPVAVIKLDDDFCKELSRKDTVLFQKDNIKVKVKYYWDSHGRLVPWHGDNEKQSETYKGNVEITKKEIVREYKYGGIHNEEYWNLRVNGKEFSADVKSYNYNPGTNVVKVKLICGWG